MGRKGDEDPEPMEVRTDDTFLPKLRHHRLDLGTTKAPMISSSSADKIVSKKRHFATTGNFNNVTEKVPKIEAKSFSPTKPL
jgi:hypothetical protein